MSEQPGCWIVEFDYREDNGPTRVGPWNTKAGAEAWLARQSEYVASVVPVAWHNDWLPVDAPLFPKRAARSARSAGSDSAPSAPYNPKDNEE